MKLYCAECGREIKNAHYLDGKVYGYNCYKQKLALIYKKWEDERNAEYSAKCFAAMEIFKNKKSNSFHDSIIKQWNDCKKLTAKQLECIIKGFSDFETLSFYKVWFLLSNNDDKRKSISTWTEILIQKTKTVYLYVEDEEIHNILLLNHPSGIHFLRDIEDAETDVFFRDNGKYLRRKEQGKRVYDSSYLEEDKNDEYYEILKVVG